MPLSEPLVSLASVTRTFSSGDQIVQGLQDVNLEVQPREFVAIAGPSGCGKTTLLSILGLLDVPSGGEYRLGGRRVDGFGTAERARIRGKEIGFVFQTFNLIGDLTVFENVELPLSYAAVPEKERHGHVREALDRVGMADRSEHYPWQLSGGQQQRTAVARAIVNAPRLILADEPTGNLDSRNGDAVMELLRGLHAEGATICMVTHDPRYAHEAGRTVHLFDGRIVAGAEGHAADELHESGFEVGG